MPGYGQCCVRRKFIAKIGQHSQKQKKKPLGYKKSLIREQKTKKKKKKNKKKHNKKRKPKVPTTIRK
jgi:hypothetical protein